MKPRDFWQWFQDNESRLWAFDPDTHAGLLDELQHALAKYHGGLSFELSDVEAGKRDLIISADGQPDLFAVIDNLVLEAPPLPRWKIVALRPPQGFDFEFDAGSIELSPNQMKFEPLSDDARPLSVGIRILVPQKQMVVGIEEAVRRIVTMGLGEREATTQIQHLEVEPLPNDAEDFLPLTDLEKYLHWKLRRPQ